jgi:hypothetical protein
MSFGSNFVATPILIVCNIVVLLVMLFELVVVVKELADGHVTAMRGTTYPVPQKVGRICKHYRRHYNLFYRGTSIVSHTINNDGDVFLLRGSGNMERDFRIRTGNSCTLPTHLRRISILSSPLKRLLSMRYKFSRSGLIYTKSSALSVAANYYLEVSLRFPGTLVLQCFQQNDGCNDWV